MTWTSPQLLCSVLRARAKTRAITVLPLLQVGRFTVVVIRERRGRTVWPEPAHLRPIKSD